MRKAAIQSISIARPVLSCLVNSFTDDATNVRDKVYSLPHGDSSSPQPISKLLGRMEQEVTTAVESVMSVTSESPHSPVMPGNQYSVTEAWF